MAQRLVFLNVPMKFVPDNPGESSFIDLDPEKLAKGNPELAKQLNGGRIVSHTVHTLGIPAELIMTLVVQD